jgi:hypothetical protein
MGGSRAETDAGVDWYSIILFIPNVTFEEKVEGCARL